MQQERCCNVPCSRNNAARMPRCAQTGNLEVTRKLLVAYPLPLYRSTSCCTAPAFHLPTRVVAAESLHFRATNLDKGAPSNLEGELK